MGSRSRKRSEHQLLLKTIRQEIGEEENSWRKKLLQDELLIEDMGFRRVGLTFARGFRVSTVLRPEPVSESYSRMARYETMIVDRRRDQEYFAPFMTRKSARRGHRIFVSRIRRGELPGKPKSYKYRIRR